eukprot:scaffold308858_cov33-Tisochrysis_lutea.AAC.2
MSVGDLRPAASTEVAKSPRSASTTRWVLVVPSCTATAGVVAGRPAEISPAANWGRVDRPMYTTSVWEGVLGARMASDKADRVSVVAVCERHAKCRRDARCRGDAGHNLYWHATRLKVLELLSATPEDSRVAALEADDRLARGGIKVEQAMNFLLRARVQARLLTHIEHCCVLRDERQHFGRDEPVIEHKVG